MIAGHTPGPWAVNADDMSDNDALTIGINDPNGEFLASANGFVAEEYEPGVWGAGLRGDIEVVRSNARLIAAAPELLAELRKFRRAYVNLLEGGRDRILQLGGDCDPLDAMASSDPYLRSASAAIDKATKATP